MVKVGTQVKGFKNGIAGVGDQAADSPPSKPSRVEWAETVELRFNPKGF